MRRRVEAKRYQRASLTSSILLAFLGLCVVLFALPWYLTKRRWNRSAGEENDKDGVSVCAEEIAVEFRGCRSVRRDIAYHGVERVQEEGSYRIGVYNEQWADAGRWGVCAVRPDRQEEETHDVNDPWDHRNYSMALRDSLTQSIHYPEHSKGFPRPDHQRTTGELRNASQTRYSGGESRVDDLAEVGLGQLLRPCGEN
jgi:hypothetical protein